MHKLKAVGPSQLRSFGLIMGGVFSLIALWPIVFHGTGVRVWALSLAIPFLALAFLVPVWLRPIYTQWMRLGAILGWINTRIILGICFYGLFTPMGAVMRLLGKNPLHLKFDPHAKSYRVNRVPRPPDHMRKQY